MTLILTWIESLHQTRGGTSSQHPDRRPRSWRLREPAQLSLGSVVFPLYEEDIATDPTFEPSTFAIDAIADALARELEWFLAGRRLGGS